MKNSSMPRHPHLTRIVMAIIATTLVTACSTSPKPADPASGSMAPSGVESIFVVRSLRVERTLPSAWCTADRVGFAPLRGPSLLEDRFTVYSIESDAQTGHLTNTQHRPVGELRTCFGNTTDPRVFNFYAQGMVGGIVVTGRGECVVNQPNYPEPGINPIRCYLQLRDLPLPYVGGLLTSSTVSSKAVLGLETDPPGYTHSSIATIRLWRQR